jgi:hypothetical protein
VYEGFIISLSDEAYENAKKNVKVAGFKLNLHKFEAIRGKDYIV